MEKLVTQLKLVTIIRLRNYSCALNKGGGVGWVVSQGSNNP